MFDVYLALGDSMSIDYYPYQDASREGYGGREEIGAASLFFENESVLFPEFAGRDLKTLFPDIKSSNYAIDGATTQDLLSPVRQSDLRQFTDQRNLVTLTMGGNDLLSAYLSTKLADTDALLDELIAMQKRYVQVLAVIKDLLPKSTVILTTVFDPTDGSGVMAGNRFFGDKMPIEYLSVFNEFVKKCARESGRLLADVHKHFLGHGAVAASPAEFWYFVPSPIEPSFRGASEIRRVWLETLQATRD